MKEEERKRLAREIHDTLGQELTGFKIDLLWLKKQFGRIQDPSIRRMLGDKVHSMMGLLDTMVRGVKKICLELRPGILDLGLAPALEWQAGEFERRSGVKCRLVNTLPADMTSLDAETSTQLFRIFQEIMTNVLRHARATEVRVRLGSARGGIVLEVQDDGRGIDFGKNVAEDCLGLRGMKERAFFVGGTVTIRGRAGKGTTVRVEVPVREEKATP